LKTWVISDTHFNHANIIKYCKRPFADVNEMNRVMIQNWNRIVSEEDDVIHAGDFALGGNPEGAAAIMNCLKGHIVLTLGNHDHKNFVKEYRKLAPKVFIAQNWCIRSPRRAGENVWFSHFPTDRIGTSKDYHICGHTHDKPKNKPRQFNASVELINYTPVLLDDILDTMDLMR
jgi:calcineurin-like phosphoesterase family protein